MTKKYPKWIAECTKSFHHEFKNMVPASFGPVDGFALFASLNGTFISKVHEAIVEIKKRGHSIKQVAQTFSSPSSLRVVFYFLLYEYQHSKPKHKTTFREIVDYFVEILSFLAKKDIFAYKSNIVHTDEEIVKLLKETSLEISDPDQARALGRFLVSLHGLAYASFGDFFPQEGSETYGPYDVSKEFRPNSILLIKHFPRIKPQELWPEFADLKYSEVKVYQIYKDVSFRCGIIGMHSVTQGDVINNLLSYAVFVDGHQVKSVEKIRELTAYFAKAAQEQSRVYDQMSKQDLKRKMLEWECYCLIDFFKLTDIDWRPAEKMWEMVKDKEMGDRTEIDSFPSFREYVASPEYEAYWLKDLYK